VGVEPIETPRSGAEKAEARDLLAAGDALEEKAHRRDLRQSAVEREWRQAVAQELARVRDRPPRARVSGNLRGRHRPPRSRRTRAARRRRAAACSRNAAAA